MQDIDNEFPHLFGFIQTNMDDNTGVISPDVAKELQMLIHAYEVNKESDMGKFLKKVQILEEENFKLAEQVSMLNSNIKDGKQIHLNLKKSALENKSALDHINNQYESRLMDMERKNKILEEEKDYLNDKIEKIKNNDANNEKSAESYIEKIKELEKEKEMLTINLKKELENNGIIIPQLKEELNDKRKECENLRMNLKKTNKEGMKLRKLNELLRATHKGNETVAKNLRRELREERENHKIYTESIEKRCKKDDELIITLVNNIKQKNFDMKKIEELLEKFNKRKMVFEDSISMTEEVKLNKSKLGNLEEYEKMFDSSMDAGSQDVSDINMDDMNLEDLDGLGGNIDETLNLEETNEDTNGNLNVIKEMRDDISKEISMIEDEGLDDTLKINETMNEPNLDISDNKDVSFVKKKEAEKEKISLPKQRASFGITRQFQTNKEKILDDLNTQLADKVKFLTNVRPTTFDIDEITEFNNEGLQETIRDLRGLPKQYLLYDSLLNENDFLKAVEYLEEYLKSDKNSTTFTMNAHEKRTVIKKFKESSKKNLETYSRVFFELFIGHIYYLENTISGLTKDNSYKEIKEQNMKSEMEYLIQQFLKKNEKNQTLLNKTNQDYMKLKKMNKKKLDKHELGRTRRQTQKMKEFVNLKSEKNINSKKVVIRKDVRKRKDRRYTRPVTEEDVANINKKNIDGNGKDSGLWDKVTNWF